MAIETTLKGIAYPQQENIPESQQGAFDCIKIGIASPQRILSWSRGEVTKPETINYRTLKPERDGLFCERIFGPAKDWECHCGKYKRVRHRGIICERCGVEVTDSKVRRHRMGHIKLAAPVIHIWYLKGIPSYMSLLLDMPLRALEEVAYYNAYVVLKDATLTRVASSSEEEEDGSEAEPAPEQESLSLQKGQLLNEDQYEQLCNAYGERAFEAEMGAPALKKLLGDIDIKAESEKIWGDLTLDPTGQKRIKMVKRLRVIENFLNSGANPTWMVLDAIPVIPPDLRPMVQLDGGRFATSDLNDLYRRVINRNNRLNRLLEMEAPDIIIRNEKRMLQEAVDALFDNGRRGRLVVGPNNRPLKSLSDIVEGKQGRFRQNLLGKRVDYSGRSVIVVGPPLKLHQCGLPKEMALELFKPFVMNKLVERGVVQNIKSAKKTIERQENIVWDILEDVIKGHPVMLNRAPTLHRLGIQAFEPVLVEGRAIQLHPLVCTAFNADFDGDQMAVHVPLSIEAQTEARLLMMADNNILLPATGRPIITPTQDMVIGCYYMTADNPAPGLKGENTFFSSIAEALAAYQAEQLDVHAWVFVRVPSSRLFNDEPLMVQLSDGYDGKTFQFKGTSLKELEEAGKSIPKFVYIRTTAGRITFNESLPTALKYRNCVVDNKQLSNLIAECYEKYGTVPTAQLANNLKDAGFHYATKAGVSITISDLAVPEEKKEIVTMAEKAIETAQDLFQRGKITEAERYARAISVWHEATEDLTDKIKQGYDRMNSVYMMAFSGARGNISQVRQLVGMRGLMADPSGHIIDLPIKSNFKEGLNVTEYVLSSYGARKGIVDTALRTADSGYLTRRLADVAQDVIITSDDCGSDTSFALSTIKEGESVLVDLSDRIMGRVAGEDVVDPKTGKTIIAKNEVFQLPHILRINQSTISEVKIRSPLGCRSEFGICRMCYGTSLTNNRLVDKGEPVGILAAQSIGEPGTQLTMRTFHTGGVFEGTRVERVYAPTSGEVDFNKKDLQTQRIRTQIGEELDVLEKEMLLTLKSGKRSKEIKIPAGFSLTVVQGDKVSKQDSLAMAVRESGKFGRGSMETVQKNVISDISGQVRFDNFKEGERKDRLKQQPTKVANKDGTIWVESGDIFALPPKCKLTVKSNQNVKSGDTLGSIETITEYGGRVQVSTGSGDEDTKNLSIVTAELALKNAKIEHHGSEYLLHLPEKAPLPLLKLVVSHNSRLENNGVLAETFDHRHVVERNGTIHYIPENINEKEPLAKEIKAIFLHEEAYSVKGDTIYLEDDQEIKAETELMPGIKVTEDGFLSMDNLDTSHEFLFYPGAKAYTFPDEEGTKITVEEGMRVKAKAELGELVNPETGEVLTIKSDIEGFVQMLPREMETIIIIRPYDLFKLKPLDPFYELTTSSDKIDLIPVTRLMHRHGDRLKAGDKLTKVQLRLKLLTPLISLGSRVQLEEEEGSTEAKLKVVCMEILSTRSSSQMAGGDVSPEFQNLDITTIPQVKDGQIVKPKETVANTEYKVKLAGHITLYQDPVSNATRIMLLTPEHEATIKISTPPTVKEGDPVFEGDEIAKGVKSTETGIVTKTTKNEVTIRKARPYLVNGGSVLLVSDQSMVKQGEVLAILTYEQMKTGDIIQGLPRVEELLETRKPKEAAILSEYSGTIELAMDSDQLNVFIIDENGTKHDTNIPQTASLIVGNGQLVSRGEPLTTGAINPHELLKSLNIQAAQRYLVDGVQRVYRSQGVKIADKHIEVIVRQMTRKCRIDSAGDTTFLPNEIVSEAKIREEVQRIEALGKTDKDLTKTPILLGITKASLNTESFISAASFQETTRVLTEAAVEGKRDWLRGLKENVIIGRLIPAGTGMRSDENRQELKDKQLSISNPAFERQADNLDAE